MNSWLAGGVLLMLAGLGVLLAMVVGSTAPSLALSVLSYGILFVGVFCFTAGVMRQR